MGGRSSAGMVVLIDSASLFLLLSAFAVSGMAQLLQAGDAYDYCDARLKLCDVPTDHTMCKYPTPGLSSRCTPAVHEPLSTTEKKRILFWHNIFRSNVANGSERNKNRKLPTASNMRQLYWDKELEAIAARWAEQCVSSTGGGGRAFDKCRNTKRFAVSQNVGTRRANDTTIEKQAPQMVVSWYKESKDFDPALVDKFTPPGEEKLTTRQFANIIWADTHAIGCARVIFREEMPAAGDGESKKDSVWTVERLVCNYGPAGNLIGKPIYKRGVSCADCPGDTECSVVFPGLCAIQNYDKLEGQPSLESPNEAKEESSRSDPAGSDSRGTDPEQDPAGVDLNQEQREEETAGEKEEEIYFPSREIDSESNETTTECSGEGCTRPRGYSGPTSASTPAEEETKTAAAATAAPTPTPTPPSTRAPYPDLNLSRIEEIMNSPKRTGDRYLIKPGIQLNGKCHCSDLIRSRAPTRLAGLDLAKIFFAGLVGSRLMMANLILSYF